MRTQRHSRIRTAPLVAALVAMAASGCTSTSSQAVKVVGTDDACRPERTELTAGPVSFEFRNDAKDVSELYVLSADGKVKAEVENVTSGSTRTLTTDLSAGEYDLNCKPGQKGDGIRTRVTVTSDGK